MDNKVYTFDADVFSDLYKDTYGFRPRGTVFYHPDTTDDQRQAIWDDLLIAHERAMDDYSAAIVAADEAFEKQIAANINYGAADRATAIRWIIESYELIDNDFGYFQYLTNISDRYQDEVQNILQGVI